MFWNSYFPIIFFFVIFIVIYYKLFPVFCRIESGLNVLLTPVDMIANFLLNINIGRWGGSIVRILIIGFVTVSSGYYIVSSMNTSDIAYTVGYGIVEGTSFLQFTNMLYDFDPNASFWSLFSFHTLIGLGLSSFLSFLYMRCTLDTLKSAKLHWTIYVPLAFILNAGFICISSLLTESMIAWTATITDEAVSLFQTVKLVRELGIHGFMDFLKSIGNVILFLILVFTLVMLAIITLRETLANIMYGILSVFIMLPFAMPLNHLQSMECPEIILLILLVLIMAIPDFIRANDSVRDAFRDFLEKLP